MAKRSKVTSQSFGDLLVQGLEEAVAIQEGRLQPAASRRVERTARDTRVEAPPHYDAKRIISIRKRLDVSQPVFANMLNVSCGTVQAWEQGKREATGPSLRLLEVAEKYPEALPTGSPTISSSVLSSDVGKGTTSAKRLPRRAAVSKTSKAAAR